MWLLYFCQLQRIGTCYGQILTNHQSFILLDWKNWNIHGDNWLDLGNRKKTFNAQYISSVDALKFITTVELTNKRIFDDFTTINLKS